jgi:hypothetical protein
VRVGRTCAVHRPFSRDDGRDCTVLAPCSAHGAASASRRSSRSASARKGFAQTVDILEDPGSGLGEAARSCALAQSYRPAVDASGKPIASVKKLRLFSNALALTPVARRRSARRRDRFHLGLGERALVQADVVDRPLERAAIEAASDAHALRRVAVGERNGRRLDRDRTKRYIDERRCELLMPSSRSAWIARTRTAVDYVAIRAS